MRRALAAARTGLAGGAGPFAALVVDPDDRVLAVRTNAVIALNDPTAHAELLAIRAAAAARGTYSLRGCTLVTTCAPCIMCVGAIQWAGISRVVAAARIDDARAIGFVEGPPDFDAGPLLGAVGIAFEADVERAEALAMLRAYSGPVYNG
jgi:guanine deaminase